MRTIIMETSQRRGLNFFIHELVQQQRFYCLLQILDK